MAPSARALHRSSTVQKVTRWLVCRIAEHMSKRRPLCRAFSFFVQRFARPHWVILAFPLPCNLDAQGRHVRLSRAYCAATPAALCALERGRGRDTQPIMWAACLFLLCVSSSLLLPLVLLFLADPTARGRRRALSPPSLSPLKLPTAGQRSAAPSPRLSCSATVTLQRPSHSPLVPLPMPPQAARSAL